MTWRALMQLFSPARRLPDPSGKIEEAIRAQKQSESSAMDLNRAADDDREGIEATTARIRERVELKRPPDPRIRMMLDVLKVMESRS